MKRKSTDAKPASAVLESDRGCVLVVAADLEQLLESTLRKCFELNSIRKKVQDSLFDSNGPLATFSGKLRVAYAFGLVPANTFDDIDFIRRLRNEAAHSSADFNLDQHPLTAQIEKLHCVQPHLGKIQRYSIAGEFQHEENAAQPRTVREAQARAAGFVKYRQHLLDIGATEISISIQASLLNLAIHRQGKGPPSEQSA